MKAADLMIGDWIRLTYKDKSKSQCFKVDTLLMQAFLGGVGAWCMDDKIIEPIPLTKEILELNGFTGNNLFQLKVNSVNIEISLFGGYPMYIDYPTWRYCLPMPKYVYQLQHYLRDCGLDELADNFRVE